LPPVKGSTSGSLLTATHVTPGMGAVVVPPDSPIQKPADLSGKTVAVNLLKTIG
jgi:ABC-type nitrate/sulfonate/bicarbonate transport system substrate-binding protein